MPEQRAPLRPRPPRHRGPLPAWLRTGLVLLCGFLIWLVLDATVLQYNATVLGQPGARQTAALDLLDPIVKVARFLHLDAPVSGFNEALGRSAQGGFVIPPPPPTTVPVGPTTTTTLPTVPTARHRLHVLIIGDSIGEDLAYPLQNDLVSTGVTAVNVNVQIDTGLTDLSYFNWIKQLRYDVAEYRPQLIIGMMGANDNHNFLGPPSIVFNTRPWRTQYLRNVATMFSIGTKGGTKILWVSVPIIQNHGLSVELQVIRDLQAKAARIWHVSYFDSDSVLSPHGRYAGYLNVGGQLAAVRTPDGIHLTTAGADLLAGAVMGAIRTDLHIRLP